MKKLTKLIIAFACLLTFQNCTNDDFDTRTVPNLQTQEDIVRDEEFIAENFGAFTTGDFYGTIQDQYGGLLNNVQVTIGNTTVLTDRNGIFLIKDATVYENFAHIKAKKEGYIDGSRVVIPKLEGENRIQIFMYKKEIIASVNSGEFSTVSLPNGAKINFSGGFVRQNGTAYNGQVDVVFNYLRPNSINTYRYMPGSLFAQNANNNAVALETLGMMSVNLFSPSGEELNINEFNRATLEFPITTSNAPDFIPLWYFDEERGYWKEEGQAVKFSNMYVAEVSHFTWWNCDLPLDYIEACFSLSLTNVDEAVPYYVILRRVVDGRILYVGIMTANEGVECGLIPENEEVKVEVYGSLGNCSGLQVYSETVGGFSTDTNVTISFSYEENQTTHITGMVTNCDGNMLTNGYVYIDELNNYVIDDGVIDIHVPFCEVTTVDVQVFDFDTNQWSITENVTLSTTPVHIGNVSTCANMGGAFNGNLVLSTQQEVNDFGVFNFTEVQGDVIIGNATNYTDIIDLTPLSSINYISGSLTITGNENLNSFQGLQNIMNIDGDKLHIQNNPTLTSLQGFNFSTINDLLIEDNDALTTLQGINNFTSISNLHITENDGLASLTGANNSISIEEDLRISKNNSLTSLQGIEVFNLSSQNDLHILDNDALTSLQGMEGITELRFLYIRYNDVLASLAQLENLTTVLDIMIDDNDSLVNLQV